MLAYRIAMFSFTFRVCGISEKMGKRCFILLSFPYVRNTDVTAIRKNYIVTKWKTALVMRFMVLLSISNVRSLFLGILIFVIFLLLVWAESRIMWFHTSATLSASLIQRNDNFFFFLFSFFFFLIFDIYCNLLLYIEHLAIHLSK